MITVLLWITSIACVLLGIAGTIVPALPGAPLVFVGLLCHAWIGDFSQVGWFSLTLLAILTVLTLAVDVAASALGAKRVGASAHALFGAAAGSIIGIFFGLIGIFFGPFVGAAAGEYYAKRDFAGAGKVGFGTWVGMLVGTVLKIGIIFAMIGYYVAAVII